MNYKEDIKSITYMKTNSADLINEVKKNRRPILITQNGEPQAVVQDVEEFQKQQDLLAMLRLLALGEKEIQSGKVIEQKTLFANVQKRLTDNK